MTNYPLNGVAIPIADVNSANDLWCVYEHHVAPHIIYVNACRLNDVFRMREARDNSEWCKMFAKGGSLMLVITLITPNRNEAVSKAIERTKAIDPMPRCNLHGWNMNKANRPIVCSNGMTYKTQKEAADALGLAQSNISRHLRGDLSHVGGFTFAYGVPDQ